MTEWNSEQYLKFKKQRTQPAIDLARRIESFAAQSVLDLGCGPGNSTRVLKEFFPDAHIIGIDSSRQMIEKAIAENPDLEFQHKSAEDICQSENTYDLIFSNACLQWIPDHQKLLPQLFSRLNKNGILAVQVPINAKEPLFQIIEETISEEKWSSLSHIRENTKALDGGAYHDILSSLTQNFDIWETTYFHRMPSIHSIIEWVKGTRLMPYMQALSSEDAECLVDEIEEKASAVYKTQENGEIIFRFRRLFFIAVR